MSQDVIKGVEHLLPVLNTCGKFLFAHENFFDKCSIKPLFDNIDKVDFTDFSANPLYEDVCNGVNLFNSQKCDSIVAIGGGSTIDVAKCIKLYCRMDKSKNYLEQEKVDTKVPLIAIPTTAGTGSESTRHAVIYYKGVKQSISHDSILPNYAILVPELLKTLPVYQKKCTMMDALCQAIESWWSVNSTDESKEYSRKAIVTIKDNWREYIFENTDCTAEQIMEAANYAGRAINITETTAAHAMSYKITSMYNFPHGHAVAICMYEVWKYMSEHIEDCIDVRGTKYFSEILRQISEIIDISQYKVILNELGLSYPKAENKSDELNVLVRSVNPTRLKNNPISLSKDVLEDMYGRILK